MSAPTGTVYPGTLDTSTSIGSAVSSGQVIASVYVDTSSSALLAVEGALGTIPQGSDATVGAALTARARKTDVQDQALTYAVDTGTANAYAVALSPSATAYTAGLGVVFKAANSNTGASTLNVNSLGTQSLVKNGSTALAAGDINAGQIYTAIFDGTTFQVTGGISLALPVSVTDGGTGATTASGARTNLGMAQSGANADITSLSGLTTPLSAGQGGTGKATWAAGDVPYAASASPSTLSPVGIGTQGQVLTVNSSSLPGWSSGSTVWGGTDTGSANAYVVTTTPTVSLTPGVMVRWIPSNTNTGASTINVDSLGSKSITRTSLNALLAGDLVAGQVAEILYDGTEWQLLTSNAQYSQGLWIYGDGSDGAVTLTANTTLTRNMYYQTLDLAGFTLNPAGFMVVVQQRLNLDGGAIACNGSAGNASGAAATGLTSQFYLGSNNSGAGGTGDGSASTSRSNNCLGGSGGQGGNGSAFTGGTGGAATAPAAIYGGVGAGKNPLVLLTGKLFGALLPLAQGPTCSGGGGGGDSTNSGASGGTGAGWCVVIARWIVGTGTIEAAGGIGGSPTAGNTGGGGGGGGGLVGIISENVPSGLTTSVAGGAGGTGHGTGSNGTAGSAGNIYQLRGAF